MTFLKLYLVAFCLFLGLDFLWLGFIAKDIYRHELGFLLAKQFKMLPAVLFYLIYIAGLVFFCIHPAVEKRSCLIALATSAFFGLIAYATYDLTNLATLNNWPTKIVVIDLIWGVALTGAVGYLTTYLAEHFKGFFRS
jgi:uncharacterized membrane protein